MSTVDSYLDVIGPRFFLLPAPGSPAVDDIVENVIKFEYHQTEKKQDQLTLTVANPGLQYNDDPRFTDGFSFLVRWGYASDMSALFTAVIVQVKPTFPPKGVPTLELVAYDLLRGTNRKSNSFNWGEKISSSTIATEIAERYNMQKDIVESNDARAQSRVQPASVTDFQYLTKLANKLNWDFYFRGGTLHFHPKRYDDPPLLTFNYFTDALGTLLSFTPEVNLNKPPKVGVAYANQKDASSGSKDGDGGVYLGFNTLSGDGQQFQAQATGYTTEGDTILLSSSESDKKVANLHADAHQQKIQQKAVKAKAVFVGSPSILCHSIVKINGLGKVYSGNWRINDVKHTIVPSGNIYVVDANLDRNGLNVGSTKTKDKVNNQDATDDSGKSDVNFVTQTPDGKFIPKIQQ